jgi:hypothetical protein
VVVERRLLPLSQLLEAMVSEKLLARFVGLAKNPPAAALPPGS